MSKITGNEPAYPCGPDIDCTSNYRSGLTIRQYFAAMAMQGACNIQGLKPEFISKRAIQLADALIEELNKQK